jgi:hypothetical protein
MDARGIINDEETVLRGIRRFGALGVPLPIIGDGCHRRDFETARSPIRKSTAATLRGFGQRFAMCRVWTATPQEQALDSPIERTESQCRATSYIGRQGRELKPTLLLLAKRLRLAQALIEQNWREAALKSAPLSSDKTE